MSESTCCGGGARILFSCSGAADTGEICDRATRQLQREGLGRMSCLALVGAGSSGLVASANGADAVLALDGCPTDCARKVLEANGITGFIHLRATDLGLVKGKTPVTHEAVEQVATEGRHRLAEKA